MKHILIPKIEPNTWLKTNGITAFYIERTKISNKVLENLVKKIAPDLLYLNSFWSYDFSIRLVRLKQAGKIRTPILLAPRGMLSSGAMGLKSTKKSVFLKIGKMFRWYRNVNFQATQATERNEILQQFSSARAYIAPNVNAGVLKSNTSEKQINVLRLFYLSRIAKVKNLHFALECLLDLPAFLTIDYTIYGNIEDQAYWQHCQELIARMPANIRVTHAGELMFTEVQDKLVAEQVLFLPTLNENFGHSIVESLLCGCPVIISDQTPWNDLENSSAGFALSLDNKAAFKKAIQYYAGMDTNEFTKASVSANNYISNKIDLEGIKKQYRQLIHECTENQSE